MQSRIRRVMMTGAVLLGLTLATGALVAPPASAQMVELTQDGCWADACGVVPAAWNVPHPDSFFVDAVNFTNYANVTNYVEYRNTINAVNYTNLANYVAYRNAVNYLTWAAGQ